MFKPARLSKILDFERCILRKRRFENGDILFLFVEVRVILPGDFFEPSDQGVLDKLIKGKVIQLFNITFEISFVTLESRSNNYGVIIVVVNALISLKQVWPCRIALLSARRHHEVIWLLNASTPYIVQPPQTTEATAGRSRCKFIPTFLD